MQTFNRYKFLLIFALIAAFSCADAAETEASYQKKLDKLRDKITHVVSELSEDKNKRNSVKIELRKLEVKIALSAKKLRESQKQHKKSAEKLEESQIELEQLKQSLDRQRKILADQLRSAYEMGQQPKIKMLLNQQDTSEMGRAMVYYDYLNRARKKEIELFLMNIEKQKVLEANIEVTTNELSELVMRQTVEKEKLDKHRANRSKILTKLNRNIKSQQRTLKELHSSRGRIEKLLMSLGELMADIPAEGLNKKPFIQMRRKLPWPVKGKIRADFGASRQRGDLKWNGVVIDAKYNVKVRAITYGRVAFADWLQGYGFITIIDHKDGYMSLYGYTQELYKKVGDWVEASEVIATVGDSGGQPKPGLYFEIRKQGKPVNPKKWCSSRIRHKTKQKK